MQKGALYGSIAAAGLIAVAVTVTLVITLQESKPKPQLERAVAKGNQGDMMGQVTPQAGMFWGIPFSQPPVGEYRWKNPRPYVPFEEKYYDATFMRPACIQLCHQPAEEYSCPTVWDEDCLYLNIWVPKRILKVVESDEIIDAEHYVIDEKYQDGGDDSLAVMLFLYGGNFLNGAGSATLYDSRYIADQGNIIGVTTNYRVGPLGFLVQGQGDDAAVGNYGIWDQVSTLEWIKDNIKFFGGNPNKVTVFGQSAGAESIGVMMTSPHVMDRGLFQQCIMESNPFGLPFRDFANAKEFGSRFTEEAGCLRDDMECLRKVDTDTILQAFLESSLDVVGVDKLLLVFQPWSPVIDGDFLPEQPVDAFEKGNMLQIPSIMGGTIDEVVLYIAFAFGSEVNNVQYRAVLRAILKEDAGPVIDRYPPTCRPVVDLDCDNRPLMGQMGTELIFLCPTRFAMFPLTNPDTYFYIFNETWSFYELWEIPPCFDKVCHAAELPYVFNVENLTVHSFAPHERILSERMGFYWTNFAKYGNPNGPSEADLNSGSKDSRLGQITNGEQVEAVYWPKFKENGGDDYYALQINGDGDFQMKNPYQYECDFFDSLDSYAEHFNMP